MKTIANLLYQIDKVIFEHNFVQYFLVAFFVTHLVLTSGDFSQANDFTQWIRIGLLVYVGLFGYRFAKNKNELSNIKKLYQEKGFFPFLKGFNYSLLLGPLGILLAIFLAMLPKED